MKNYELYEKLNIYIPNEKYHELKNLVEEILVLSTLKNYNVLIAQLPNVSASRLIIENEVDLFSLYFNFEDDKKLIDMSLYFHIDNLLQIERSGLLDITELFDKLKAML